MSYMVTGGAGYIGSHIVSLLQQQGKDVVVVDDLSSGDARRIGEAPLINVDVASGAAQKSLEGAIRDHHVDVVIHVAAKKRVAESMERPTYYFQQNVGGLANVLAAMESTGVDQIVFSSSAAAYGTPDVDLVREDVDCRPINTYGETKLIGEWMLSRAAAALPLRAVSLRYFNVAGAGADDMGDPTAFNLIPIAFGHVVAHRPPVVFGSDYLTPDGTCIRDYVHVVDLAEAHLAAIEWTGGQAASHEIVNVGTGSGSSVLDVIREVGLATGLDSTPEFVPRRPGDPARLIADVHHAADVLGWASRRDLRDMVTSAWSAYTVRTATE